MSQDTAAPQGQEAQHAPDMGIDVSKFDKFFGGLAPGESVDPGAPAEPAVAAPAEKAAEPAPEAAPEPSKLAEKIRAEREARVARQREQAQVQTVQTELARAQARIAELESAESPDDDIVAYARKRGWDKKKQATMGELLLYDLVPDQATPEVRQRLFETKQALREREAEARRQAEEAQRAQAEGLARIQAYQQLVVSSAETFEPGAFPESEDYFGEDRSSYHASLMATANNMAEAARQSGHAADLSPANVARKLEAAIAEREQRREQRRGTRNQERKAEPGPTPKLPVGKQPEVTTMSTTDLRQGNGARSPAKSEDERLARAAEVVFGKR